MPIRALIETGATHITFTKEEIMDIEILMKVLDSYGVTASKKDVISKVKSILVNLLEEEVHSTLEASDRVCYLHDLHLKIFGLRL